MSIRAAMIAVLVCALLGGAAWWLGRTGRTALPPLEPAPAFEAGRVSSLSVSKASEATRLVERSEAGDWILRGVHSWPIEVVRVRAASSLISQLIQGAPSKEVAEFGTGVRIIASDQGGNQVTIDLADAVVGGQLFVKVISAGEAVPTVRIAKADVAAVFTPQGLDAWRSRSVFATLADQPVRISLASPQQSMVLRRNLGRWGIERSPPVAADAERVKALIAALATLRVERFLDGAAAAMTGLETPAATIEVSTELRSSPDEQSRTIVQILRIGRAADAAASTIAGDLKAVWADSGEVVWGPQAFAVPVAQVSELTADAARFVAGVCVSAPRADVGAIRASEAGGTDLTPVVEWKRTLDGWSVVGGPDDVGGFGADVLKLLTTPGVGATFRAPEGTLALATLSVWTPGGAMIDVVHVYSLGSEPLAAGHVVWSRVGEVWRPLALGAESAAALEAVRNAMKPK